MYVLRIKSRGVCMHVCVYVCTYALRIQLILHVPYDADDDIDKHSNSMEVAANSSFLLKFHRLWRCFEASCTWVGLGCRLFKSAATFYSVWPNSAGQPDLHPAPCRCCRKMHSLFVSGAIPGVTSVHLRLQPGTLTV
jgi:hypothetical protein